jgi:hypothetical protein
MVSPMWTKPAVWSAGRGPLGMQATSVRLYRRLAPGLTNVTNRLRYFLLLLLGDRCLRAAGSLQRTEALADLH